MSTTMLMAMGIRENMTDELSFHVSCSIKRLLGSEVDTAAGHDIER